MVLTERLLDYDWGRMGPEGIVALIEWHSAHTGRKLSRIIMPERSFRALARECHRQSKFPNGVSFDFESEFQVMGVTIGKARGSEGWQLVESLA